MKARLLLMNPQDAPHPPLEPTLLVEDDGVKLYSSGWIRALYRSVLEEVTLEDVRQALRLQAEEKPLIFLSAVRPLPEDNLMSPAALAWMQQWWIDEVTELARAGRIPDAPAVKVTA